MASPSTTRDRLIFEGMRQLLAHGYEGVGIGPILKAVDVPKGSFYYFFKSKDDYVIAIIHAYAEKYRQMREAIFADVSKTNLARLNEYLETLERELVDEHPFGGCLYGVIAQTVAGRNEAIREALSASYSDWEQSLRALLLSAQACDEVGQNSDVGGLAASIVDAYEGVLIRMKASNDVAAFTRFRTLGLPRMLTGNS